MAFAQLVVGPPGSGKSTYCNGMYQMMSGLERKVAVVNLDPANDSLSYPCAINVEELVCLEEVMREHELGPNGGLVFCMEYIEANLDWLLEQLEKHPSTNIAVIALLDGDNFFSLYALSCMCLTAQAETYFIFDCPGQVELYTNHERAKKTTVDRLIPRMQMTCVHLVDSTLCASPANFISAAMLSLSAMIRLELPHVNVLSKVDLLRNVGSDMAFPLDVYTDLPCPERLAELLESDDPFLAKFASLNHAVCELIDDFRLVSFQPLHIEDKESTYNLLKVIDKSNGYVFGGLTEGNESIMEVADADGFEYFRVAAVQDKYMNAEDWEDSE